MVGILSAYQNAKGILIQRPDVIKVELDEDYVPPHKQAGFVPYDIIIRLEPEPTIGAETWTKKTVAELLYSHGIEFDYVTGIRELETQTRAFVSLEEY